MANPSYSWHFIMMYNSTKHCHPAARVLTVKSSQTLLKRCLGERGHKQTVRDDIRDFFSHLGFNPTPGVLTRRVDSLLP